MRARHATAAGLAMFLALAGCWDDTIEGSGTRVTKAIEVTEFSAIAVEGIGEVTVSLGAAPGLTVTTDDNLLEYLEVAQDGGELRLRIKEDVSINPTDGLRFTATTVALSSLRLLGSGSITADALVTDSASLDIGGSGSVSVTGIDAASVTATISGSGSVTLAGRAADVSVTLDGSGEMALDELETASARVRINGSGAVTVAATDTLDAAIAGSGVISYIGAPRLTQSIEGSGQITAAGR